MKTTLLLISLLFSFSLVAQEGRMSEERRNQFEAQKVAFFTQKLELTPTEAAVFWPLYNEMDKKIRKLEFAMRRTCSEMRKTKNISDEETKKCVLQSLEKEQEILNIKKSYYIKLLAGISPNKVSKLDWVDHHFRRQLLEQLRKNSKEDSK